MNILLNPHEIEMVFSEVYGKAKRESEEKAAEQKRQQEEVDLKIKHLSVSLTQAFRNWASQETSFSLFVMKLFHSEHSGYIPFEYEGSNTVINLPVCIIRWVEDTNFAVCLVLNTESNSSIQKLSVSKLRMVDVVVLERQKLPLREFHKNTVFPGDDEDIARILEHLTDFKFFCQSLIESNPGL
jgi:hypothetical protein